MSVLLYGLLYTFIIIYVYILIVLYLDKYFHILILEQYCAASVEYFHILILKQCCGAIKRKLKNGKSISFKF